MVLLLLYQHKFLCQKNPNNHFEIIDPTSVNKQGNDRGSQYRTGIYYVNQNDKSVIQDEIKEQQKKYSQKIVVEVLPLKEYYLAEEYHQDI